jgi:hypothetical protein
VEWGVLTGYEKLAWMSRQMWSQKAGKVEKLTQPVVAEHEERTGVPERVEKAEGCEPLREGFEGNEHESVGFSDARFSLFFLETPA